MLKAKEQGLKTNIFPPLLAIPACCDIVGSTLMFIALTQVAGSVYQMMRGLIVVFTALGSIIFLKRRLHRHHWLGVVVLTVGIGIVGFASLWHEKKNPESEKQTTSVIGILFLLGSQIAVAAMMIVEEKLLSKYYLNPLKVVGWEGVWAMSIYSIMLIIL